MTCFSAEFSLHVLHSCFFCGGKFQLSVCKYIKPLPDAALCRSTSIHHTLQFYAKRELVGAEPLHLAYARPFGRLKAPLGLSLLRFASQMRTFENALLSAACKKRQGKLWQKERGPDDAYPLDKAIIVKKFRTCLLYTSGCASWSRR